MFRELGAGFLEQVYHRALLLELTQRGLSVESEKRIPVQYKGSVVGDYVADIVVERKVILELKAQNELSKMHEAQLLNYLRATGIKIRLLINFVHPKAEIRRFVL